MIRRTLVLGLAFMTLIAAWGFARHTDPNPAPAAQGGSPLVLEASHLQSQVAGKPVAYLFVAFGCTSCLSEIQAMDSAARTHSAVQLVGVDMTGFDAPGDLSDWLQASGLASTRFKWTIDKDGSLVRTFGVTAVGTSVLVDSSGKVRFVNPINIDPSVLAKQLGQLT